MPFLNSLRSSFGPQSIRIRMTQDGLTSATAFTSFNNMNSVVSTSGNYWLFMSGMSQPRQMFIDASTGGGRKWVRVFTSTTNNYSTTSYSWDNSDVPALIDNAGFWMYCFYNTSNNATTQAWYWAKQSDNASDFRNTPPMGHGGIGSPLISAIVPTRISTGISSGTRYLRTGISSFGSNCDDGRGGTWGQLCLKEGGSGIGTGGHSDFPHFSTYAVSTEDDCSQSNQAYNATKCSDSRRFGIYIG